MIRTKHPQKSKGHAGRIGYWQDSMLKRVYHLASRGLTDNDIAIAFGVDVCTIDGWKKNKPEFMEALQRGKDEADAKVEKAFYQRAIGYSHRDVQIMQYQGQVITVPYIKHYPPDSFACLKWLTIRQRERWMDVQKLESTVNVNLKQINFSGFTDEELEMLEQMGMKKLMSADVIPNN